MKEFTIKEKIKEKDFIFKTIFGLFSYKNIDKGSKLLINSINI